VKKKMTINLSLHCLVKEGKPPREALTAWREGMQQQQSSGHTCEKNQLQTEPKF
jgi:hypothetical protein